MSHPFGIHKEAGRRGLNPPAGETTAGSDEGHHLDPALSPRRQQAVGTFPFLQALLPGVANESNLFSANSIRYQLTPQQSVAIWDAVDHDRPLVPLLAEQLGWEPWMVCHVGRHWPVFHQVDELYGDHAWDIGALLACWTPETAPRRLEPLRRLCTLFQFDLYNRGLVSVRCFSELPKGPLSAHDRCTLLEILEDENLYRQLCEYQDFLQALAIWLSSRTGKMIDGVLTRLLGTETIADWWALTLRWHRINDYLCREREVLDTSTRPMVPGSLGLLAEPVHIGSYGFANLPNPLYRPCAWSSRHAYREGSTSPTPMFPPSKVYVELDGIHHANLTVAVAGPTNAPTMRVLESVDRSNWITLDDETQMAVDQFVAAFNQGQIDVNRQALDFHLSGVDLRASLLERFQCIDYPSWLALFPSDAYFAAHTEMAGTAIFDAYRESLALFETAEDCIYQRALAATSRVGEPDFEFLACVADSDRELIGPTEYIYTPGR